MHKLLLAALCIAASTLALAQSPRDPELARALGADERGMRHYMLVVLRTGPTRVPRGPERDAMFEGHFANIARLSDEGKLAFAGPFESANDGWRGLFVLATADVDEAKRWVATDPVITNGEMVADIHPFYGSAALMAVAKTHALIAPPP